MTNDEMLQNMAGIEGQVLASRLVSAMLIHSARTGIPFDVIHREISGIQQLVEEDVLTLFPEHRLYFLIGFRSGLESSFGMAEAVAEIMVARGH